MSTITTLTYSGAAIVNGVLPTSHGAYNELGTSLVQGSPGKKYLLIRFPEIPSSIRYKKLLGIKIKLWAYYRASSATEPSQIMQSKALSSDFDPATVTWDTMPSMAVDSWGTVLISPSTSYTYSEYNFPTLYYDEYGDSYRDGSDPVKIAQISKSALLSNSIAFWPSSGKTYYFKNAPQMFVEVDESITISSQIKPDNSPTSGWINPTTANTFAWKFGYAGDYPCAGNFTQATAVFHWRVGTSGSWTNVTPSGSAQSVTIPANTFPGGTIQWYVSGTDTQGTSSQTSVYTLSTADSEAIATAIEPSGTVEDGSAPITFKWSVANDSGSTQTGADLQWSTDSATWTTFAQPRNAETEYSAPGGTFTAGKVYWRVRAYNRDSAPGSWSNVLQFVSVAAPAEPSVTVAALPYAVVNWQSAGQIAYKVTIDGKVYGPYFGTTKNFSVPDYLTDGSHRASVEIQGTYGLWSQPGSVTFSVTNIPGDSINLSGIFKRDAVLNWSTNAATQDFYVYRDNVRIGHTASLSFTDRFSLGEHEYYVLNKLPGGYYTRSNLVSGTLQSCTQAVAAFDGGEWLETPLSEDSDAEENFTWSAVVSERHVTGSDLPVVELSPYRGESASYKISFADLQTCAAFEALRGRRVIVKSRGGNVMIGILSTYQKVMKQFYITYVFSISKSAWEDFIDDT